MEPLSIKISSGFQVAMYPAGAVFGPRPLRDFELVWMIEGNALYFVNDTEHAAPQGSIVLCKPNTTDSFRWDPRRRTRHGWFHFELQGDVPRELGDIGTWPVVRLPTPETTLLVAIFRQMIANGHGQPDVSISMATYSLAVSLLCGFIQAGTVPTSQLERSAYPDPVSRSMAFVVGRLDERLSEPITLQAMAESAFVSSEHLCRLYRTHTGHSPAETVRLMRLDRAATLLARTNYSIGEIATICGFVSQFHFARRFKDAFGLTPSDLRREISGGKGSVPLSRLIQFDVIHNDL